MKRREMYEELIKFRAEVDERLAKLDYQNTKELFLWLAGQKHYNYFKMWDTQIKWLDFFKTVWLEEKSLLLELGIEEDVFYGVSSLQDLEHKYVTIQYGLFRIECNLPEEYCEEAIEAMIAYKASGVLIGEIITREMSKRKDVFFATARRLKEKHQIFTAIMLLQKADSAMPGDEEILTELADCWIQGGQRAQARSCLKKVAAPSDATLRLIEKLRDKE